MNNLLDELMKEEESKGIIYQNRHIFDIQYKPEKIWHRDDESKKVFNALSPLLRNEVPSNFMIYGKPGTGKTLVLSSVLEYLKANEKISENMEFFFFNCRVGNTTLSTYQLLQSILNKVDIKVNKGYSEKDMFDFLFNYFKNLNKRIIIVFDELDFFLKRNGDGLLYTLLKFHESYSNVKATFTIIGISNDTNLVSLLDARIKSALNAISLIFKPYNAVQLIDILSSRVKLGLIKDSYDDELVPRIAGLSARENGDVRMALGYLKSCVDLAIEKGHTTVTSDLIEVAVKRANLDQLEEIIKSQPRQSQLVIYAILKKTIKHKTNLISNKTTTEYEPVAIGEVYDFYILLCKEIKFNHVSVRQVRDLIQELELLGIVESRMSYRGGKWGRQKEVQFGYPNSLRSKIIKELEEILGVESKE